MWPGEQILSIRVLGGGVGWARIALDVALNRGCAFQGGPGSWLRSVFVLRLMGHGSLMRSMAVVRRW